MRRKFFTIFSLFLLTLLNACAGAGGSSSSDSNIQPTVVEFSSGGKILHGYFVKPEGNGPFPVIVFNHGSESDPKARWDLEKFYTDLGFILFEPHRSGHGLSADAGPDILTQQEALPAGLSNEEFQAAIWDLHQKANVDVISAIQWLKSQSYVDANRIVVSGYSYGGIQTIITAEKSDSLGLGVRAFVPFAPGAMSWNSYLAGYLSSSVQNAAPPIFLIQAANDYSLGPSEVLGAILEAKGTPNGHKVYPAFGDTVEQGHGGFALSAEGAAIWSPDVLAFFHATGVL